MTDKERLENMSPVGVDTEGNVLIKGEDWHWLTDQAERVQELEEANKKNYWVAADFKFENLKLEQQNKRYREALESIQDIQQWNREQPDYEVLNIVNKALEESE